MDVICNYCGEHAARLTGRDLFPHRPALADLHYYACRPCGAHVGCHPGTDRPLGLLANAELRRARTAAHAAFDPFWKTGLCTRTEAYRWLAAKLDIAAEECHIGEFELRTCEQVIEICSAVDPSLAPNFTG